MKRLLSIALFAPSLVLAQATPAQPPMPPPLTMPTPATATADPKFKVDSIKVVKEDPEGAPAKPTPTPVLTPTAPPNAVPPAPPNAPPPAPSAALPPAMTNQPPKPEANPPAATATAAVIPQAFPRDRYEASWKKNPFLLKTAPVVQAKESWGTDYALTSIAKISGTYRVSIKNKKTGESKRLTEGSDANGEFKIVNVNLQPDRKSSSVEVEKGGEKVSLTYDATMMAPQGRGGAPGAGPGGRPGMPTLPGQPGGSIPMPTIRTTSTGAGVGQMGGQSGSRQPVTAGPSYQQPQMGGGGSPGYMGNAGGGYMGGLPGVANNNTAAAGNVAAGNASGSRLGALGPRANSTGAQQNSLVPMVGGTRVTNTNNSTGSVSVNADPGNVVTNITDSAAQNTTTGTNTQVTRRRTLIPAPVVTQ